MNHSEVCQELSKAVFNIDIQEQNHQQKHPLDLNQINLHHHLTPAVNSLLVQFIHSIQIMPTRTGANSFFLLIRFITDCLQKYFGLLKVH